MKMNEIKPLMHSHINHFMKSNGINPVNVNHLPQHLQYEFTDSARKENMVVRAGAWGLTPVVVVLIADTEQEIPQVSTLVLYEYKPTRVIETFDVHSDGLLYHWRDGKSLPTPEFVSTEIS